MPDPLRAAAIYTTVALLAAQPGRRKVGYAVVLENGRFYKWVPDDTTATDGWSVVGYTGGHAGTWKDTPGDVKGADLGDTTETLTVAGKLLRYVQAAVLAANRTKTLGVTGAQLGQVLRIVRLDVGAFTLAFVNGGPAAGTITTLPASQRWFADFRFDGADWRLLGAGQMP